MLFQRKTKLSEEFEREKQKILQQCSHQVSALEQELLQCKQSVVLQKEALESEYEKKRKSLSEELAKVSRYKKALVDREASVSIAESDLRSASEHINERATQIDQEVKSKVLERLAAAQHKTNGFSDNSVFEEFTHYDYLHNPRLFSAVNDGIRMYEYSASAKAVGSNGKIYNVTLSTCTCPDFQNHHMPCKHMYRLAIEYGLMTYHKDSPPVDFSLFKEFSYEQERLSKQIQESKKLMQQSKSAEEEANSTLEKLDQSFSKYKERADRILQDGSIGSPWLVHQYADAVYLLDLDISTYYKNKKNPAKKSADAIKKISKEKRDLLFQLKSAEYRLSFYEAAFPWLDDVSDASTQDILNAANQYADTDRDPMLQWLSPTEYSDLSDCEKTQLAFDRWKKRNKSNWEIGIGFERYIGYLYEMSGYRVSYNGALMGVGDLGRDLIVRSGHDVTVIQCKRWSQKKEIHEKHVFQLYGSVTAYRFDHKDDTVTGKLICTCALSDAASDFADYLCVQCEGNYDPSGMDDYPMIKCNISSEKIYHLPFDQQYDRVTILPSRGEFYAKTVSEAESAGFRRAKHWAGSNQSDSR